MQSTNNKKGVMWVGLSAKDKNSAEDYTPLHTDTNTGKLIAQIEEACCCENSYKTNLVKFAPRDIKGKLRYPTVEECIKDYPKLVSEIDEAKPKVIFLLGIKTATFVLKKIGFKTPKLSYEYKIFEHENKWYVPIHHPSYIMIYKRKEKDLYIRAVKSIIEKIV